MKRSSIAPHSSCQSRLNVDVRLLRLHVSARSRREPCWRSVPDDLGANNGDGRLILDYRNPERGLRDDSARETAVGHLRNVHECKSSCDVHEVMVSRTWLRKVTETLP
jgi:hypothetical protein